MSRNRKPKKNADACSPIGAYFTIDGGPKIAISAWEMTLSEPFIDGKSYPSKVVAMDKDGNQTDRDVAPEMN